MKKYPAYKPTNIEWIGDIPDHWEVKKLKYILSTVKSGEGISSDVIKPDGVYPVYGGNGIMGYTDNYNSSQWDIIIGRVGAKCGNIHLIPGEKWISDNALFTRTDENIRFVAAALTNLDLNRFANQNAQPLITSSLVKEQFIVLPNSKEQQSIVSFLNLKTSEIDETILKKKRLIELLLEEQNALINQTVIQGIDVAARLKPSGVEWLGNIPAHWKVSRMKYVVTINDEVLSETEDENYKIRYVEISSISEGKITTIEEYTYNNAPSRARRKVRNGDVIVSTVRTYLKAIATIVDPDPNLIVSTGFAVIRPRKVSSQYLGYLCLSTFFISEIISRSKGVSYPGINASDIGEIYIPLPDDKEQNEIILAISNEVMRVNAIVERIEKEIILLKEYRVALINEVVTGKICIV